MDRQGVILNEDMKNFTSNMNMNQKMFDGFLNCELGMFGSIQKNHNLVDYQKTFYSAATFNPTYPNHKDPVTNSWDGITTASQITNPLAWMEVQDDDATSHISTPVSYTHLDVYKRQGWDWGIRMGTSGIWRPVTIRYYDAA